MTAPLRPGGSSKTRKTIGVALVAGLAILLVLFAATERRESSERQSGVEADMLQRGTAVGAMLSRAVWSDWRDLEGLAASVPALGAQELRAALDQAVGMAERVSWVGFADTEGVVVAASQGMLEGASVAERPWFRAGLEGPFAGDVHEAVLLADLLPSTGDVPRRFLDLALPVQDALGQKIGVLGFHLDQAWSKSFLAESAALLGLEALIVNGEGTIVIGPEPFTGEILEIGGSLPEGGEVTELEWPDGRLAATVVVEVPGYRNLPPFGWRLAARADGEAWVSPGG